MSLNQLNFHDFDFDLKSSQIWFYPTPNLCFILVNTTMQKLWYCAKMPFSSDLEPQEKRVLNYK